MKATTAFSTLLCVALAATGGAAQAQQASSGATSSNASAAPADGTASVNVSDAIAGLKAIKFNVLAGILEKNSDKAAKFLATKVNVTFLAPTDQAFAQSGHQLDKLSPDDQWALLQYHALHGNFSTEATSPYYNQSKHTIARTFLTNKTYVDLGEENTKPQVVVLSRNAQGYPIVVEPSTNVSFASKTESFALGNLRLAGITKLLTIPGNLSDTLSDLGLKGLSTAAQATKLSDDWDDADGVTVFAPNDAAFASAAKDLKALNVSQVADVLGGHVLNGTTLYSSDLSKTATLAKTSGKTDKDGNLILANLVAAEGQNVTVLWLKGGTFALSSGNYTAKIVKTDGLFKGGVVHTIDTVLINTETDPAAAAAAYKQYSAASNATEAILGGASGGEGDNGGIANGTIPSNGTVAPNASAPGSTPNIALVSLFVGAFGLAGGLALLL
ncbi:unnamed protein product [Parajaminaea phylloscopi]